MLNSADFPDFSQVKNKKNKNKKYVHNSSNPAEDSSSSVSGSQSVSSEKYYICKSILGSGECSYGKHCKYAHYEDEWFIQNCSHGVKCNRIKGEKCKNVDPKNICLFIHPTEDIEMFYKRLKVDKNKIRRPSKDEIAKSKYFTKMCDSFFLEVDCNKEAGTCTYAHNQEQLLVKDCLYGENCRHIILENNLYSTKDSSIICMYKHPGETFIQYKERALEPRRKFLLLKKEEEKVSVAKETENNEKSWGDIMDEESIKEKKNAWNMEKEFSSTTILEPINEILPLEKIPLEKIPLEKIVIQVPERMAMEMLKLMLEKGEKNFELKII